MLVMKLSMGCQWDNLNFYGVNTFNSFRQEHVESLNYQSRHGL